MSTAQPDSDPISPTSPNDSLPDTVSVRLSDMKPWRDRIDEIDRTVLRLLNERATCANRIGAVKKILEMPVYVPSREEEVLRNVCNSNSGPLPDESVRRLFERIIDETRSLERRVYQERADDAHDQQTNEE